jgi:hypothetical protein
VTTRAFDADLYALLITDTQESHKLPEVPSLLGYGLRDSSAAAANVARNADDETLRQVVATSAQAQPLAAALQLLVDLHRMARDGARDWLLATVDDALRECCAGLEASVATAQFWETNDPHARLVLGTWAQLTSTEAVQRAVAGALAADPTMICPILIAGSDWFESVDRDTGEITGRRRRYSRMGGTPPWLPRQAMVEAISGHLSAAGDRQSECEVLAAELIEVLTG